MGLFVRQDDDRSELQRRVATELRERSKLRDELADKERPDGITDSAYMKDTKQTTSLAWVWAVIVVLFVAVVIFVIWSIGRP